MTVSATGDTPSTWVISAGNTGTAFAISNSGVITTAASLDHETTSSYTLTLVAYDSATSDVETVTISVSDVNDAPSAGSDQTGSVTEDASTSTATGTVSGTDADSDTLTYTTSSTSGTYGSFAIVAGSGAWTYTLDNSDADTTALDAGDTVTEQYTITVTDDGTGTLTDTMTVTVTITGADDAVNAGSDGTGAVTEDASPITATGTVAAIDPDADAEFTYAIWTGSVSTLAAQPPEHTEAWQ